MAKSITIPVGITEAQLHDAVVYKMTNRVDLGTHKMGLTEKKLEKFAEIGRALMLNAKQCFFCSVVVPKQGKAKKKTKAAAWDAFVACQCFKSRIHELLPQPKAKTKATAKPTRPMHKDPDTCAILTGVENKTIALDTVVHSGKCAMPDCKNGYKITAGQLVSTLKRLGLAPQSYKWTHRCLTCRQAAEKLKHQTAASTAAPATMRVIEDVVVTTPSSAVPLTVSLGEVTQAKKARC